MKKWSNTCRLVLGLLLVAAISWQTVFRTIFVIERKNGNPITMEIHIQEGRAEPMTAKEANKEESASSSSSSMSSDHSVSELSDQDRPVEANDTEQRSLFSKRGIIAQESEYEPIPEPICNFTGDCCKPFGVNDTLIWDSFTFSGDWEMLQLRLGTHGSIVHQFVILQANITFGGAAADYAYPNDSRIAPWVNCIRFVTVFSSGKEGSNVEVQVTSLDSTSEMYDASPWPPMNERDAVEIWMRDHIHYGYLTHPKTMLLSVADDDWVIFSDLDEICNPQSVQWLLKYYTGNPWFVLYFAEFAYGFWNRKAGHNAAAASLVRGHMAKRYRMAGVYFHGRRGGSSESGKCRKARQKTGLLWATWNKKPIDTACMWKRAKIHPRKVFAAGWHCSNCFPSIERILRKLCSFKWMHTILVERGWDMRSFTNAVLSGRVVHSTSQRHMSVPYKRVDGFESAPHFAKIHKKRFAYLLSPSGIAIETRTELNNCDAYK
eukprot:TRINITY_DN15652_c0_g1_i1.p1 TRINITY_DN15652_c0_g1~~TRINITY_DN15652_c0_g1_i1.p1  ORF type:complete len:490 (+),score=56.65 TRINITY_DN15652_c0_g1_i1:54-1523(+)